MKDTIARQISERYVYIGDVFPGLVLRARAVNTGDLLEKGIASVVVAPNNVPVAFAGAPPLPLQPPPVTAESIEEERLALRRVREACLEVDGAAKVTEWNPETSPTPEEFQRFGFVEDSAGVDLDNGVMLLDKLGAAGIAQLGRAILHASASSRGVARAIRDFHPGGMVPA